MDRSGLKRNGNRADSLTFVETGAGVGRDTCDIAGSLLQSAMHLPGTGSLTQSTVAPNGRGGIKDQAEFAGLFEPPQTHGLCEGLDTKEGKISRMQKQHQDISLFNMEDNLCLSDLDHLSTSVINTSASSVLGNLPLPDLFPQNIKQEANMSMDKDLGTYCGHPGTGPCDLDSNSCRLIEETEIWQDLDLPSSLPEISDFELDSEVAHLDTILHDASGGCSDPDSGLLKETKSAVGNGGNRANVNGTDPQHHPMHHLHHQQQHALQHQLHHQHQQAPSVLSSVTIKEEKDPDDSFIHIRTPGVVKQEKQDNAGFCQAQCLQGSMSSLQGGGHMSSSAFQYRASTSSRVDLQDQKPFDIFSGLPSIADSWSGESRHRDWSAMHRGSDGLPSAPASSAFSVNFSR